MGSRSRSSAAPGNITPTVPPAAGTSAPPPPGYRGSRPDPAGQRAARGSSGGGGGGGAGGPGLFAVPDDAAYEDLAAQLRDSVQADLHAEREAADAARDAAAAEWTGPEVSYIEHPEAFQAAYEEALARRARGESPVPYMTENATDGLGAPGGRGFGVEIEFDFPPGLRWPERAEALDAIGRDLHEAGLTSYMPQQPYHAGRAESAGRGHDGGWRFESDATVAGEIISPVMHDTPETWANLSRVCEIVRRHGGVASASTGGHVHVGLADYDHTVENHNRLLQTAAGYEDTLYRLAQNPDAASHRGTEYCAPNRDPGAGYASISSVRASNSGHPGLNFNYVQGTRTDHVEYRMWDGSLDPGVIQSHINISLAMTAAGSRGGYTPPPPTPRGTGLAANPGRRRLRGAQWLESTAPFRRFADTLFRREANAAQAASLFAVTRWQST